MKNNLFIIAHLCVFLLVVPGTFPAGAETAARPLVVKQSGPGDRQREKVVAVANEDGSVTITLPPEAWKRLTVVDQRTRWQIRWQSAEPVSLYLARKNDLERWPVGDPPAIMKLKSVSVRSWENIPEMPWTAFWPRAPKGRIERGYGESYFLFVHNPGTATCRVQLDYDTSGTITEKEKRRRPFMILLAVGLSLVVPGIVLLVFFGRKKTMRRFFR